MYEVAGLEGSPTEAWNGNEMSMTTAIIRRGGYAGSFGNWGKGCSVGVFTAYGSSGEKNSVTTFRPVIVVDPGV